MTKHALPHNWTLHQWSDGKRRSYAEPPGPAWRPALGTIAQIANNTLADVDPCPAGNCPYSGGGQKGVFDDWCGGALCPEAGPHGIGVYFGGGHGGSGGYLGSEYYAFDFDECEYVRANEPFTSWSFDADEGTVTSGGELRLAPSHTYTHVQYVPPSVAGNTKGWVARWVSASNEAGGSESASGRSHYIDLDDWSTNQLSSNRAELAGGFQNECCTVWDSTRNLCYLWTQGLIPTQYIGPSTSWAWTKYTEGGNQTVALDAVGDFSKELDFVVILSNRNTHQLLGFDPAQPNNGLIVLDESGTPPASNGSAFVWAKSRGCFYAWDPGDRQKLFKLTPPEDLINGTWVWSTENLTGVTIPALTNPIYNRARWHNTADSLVIPATRTSGMFAARPP